jgi:hypothetical protein
MSNRSESEKGCAKLDGVEKKVWDEGASRIEQQNRRASFGSFKK